jgi:TolB-like protein/tetratricopeptide (TPR) repeat protein
MSESRQPARVLRFEPFELDLRTREIRRRGVKLKLHGQPLHVLAVLLKRAGDLVTLEELRAEIWPSDTFVDFNHSLHNAVARLREVLGDSADQPRYIETLPRRGYRFIAAVQDVTSSPASGGRAPVNAEYPIRALGVLPLADLSAQADHEYFADGMTEALITSLAKIKACQVISRTSMMRYKNTRKSVPQIARELNVDAVIEGTVLRSGARIRVTAQLIHAASDHHLWAESYERDFRDVLSLQSEIARRIVEELRIVVTPEERARLETAPPVDPQAHECYLKARYHWNKRTEESVGKARVYFHAALAEDPAYAPACAGIADCYNILGYYNALPPAEAYAQAKAFALQALELDQSLAESHAALGVVKRDFDWDWAGAEAEFLRAISLNPGYVEAYHWRGTLLSMLSRHSDGLQEKRKALALDPLSVVVRTDLARMLYFARQFESALEHYRSALELDPNFTMARLGLAHVYEQMGRRDDALSALETALRVSPGSAFVLAQAARGRALAGDRLQTHAALNELGRIAKHKYVSPYDLALVHAGLGDRDHVFEHLHAALEHRSLWLGYLNVEPQWDSFRNDPRFKEILLRVGLTPAN